MYPTFPTPLCGTIDRAVPLALPQTLHAQLFLLAYDRYRGRLDGDDRWRFGLALRTAMLTDLYLAGHLTDENDRPHPVDGPLACNPLLRAVLDDIGDRKPQDWMHAVARDQRNVPGIVRSELEADGWLWVQRRRILGIIPTARLRLSDEDLVRGLAARVVTALRDAIAGRPADKRPLAVGLIGALGQLPTVFSFDEAACHFSELEGLVDRAIPPITGMRQVIDAVHGAIQANDTGPYST
ncbi:MAG: GPP34 family phosphoprotein [Mycobacterium sp.]|uniref:GOLPH3/VPS74 family protein n=1 Tax=Mycobacterium sp. TaxID=1785 RepID=UPI00389AA0B1